MSEATLRSLVSIVLSSAAIPKIKYRISGYMVNAERFDLLKRAIRAGKIGFELDSARTSGRGFNAAYDVKNNSFVLPPSVLQSAAISMETRSAIIHECLHAILDMDRVQAVSPIQEEACGFLTSGLYVFHHFNRLLYSADGYTTALIRRVSANPGMEIQSDPDFLKLYEKVYGDYVGADPDYGKRSNPYPGI